MKYLIERTSNWKDKDPKVEGAYPIKIHEVYKNRSAVCPDYMINKCNNVRKEGDLWVGDFKETEDYWAIDVNSLEELNALVNKVGCEIIIGSHNNTEGLMLLEIYDDYRE